MSLSFEPERGFGIYIHWPYCTQICPYCDFNVFAAKTRDVTPLGSALLADLAGHREMTGSRQVASIFFGGGTPSLMPPSMVTSIIEQIDVLWGLAPNAEISLEANPEDMGRLPDLARAGVNRMSLGVQSLNDKTLQFLGRTHDSAKALSAIELARKHVRSLSCDAIYALPDQSCDEWRSELSAFLDLPADHLSLYELTIEPGAAFARAVARGNWTPADEDISAELYEVTQEMTAAAGFDAYEISNHARAPEHRSSHNLIYWRSGDWVGVGPGAHGRLTVNGKRLATEAIARPPEYIAAVSAAGIGGNPHETLSQQDVADERLIMGLRMQEGIAMADFDTLSGKPINPSRLDEFIDSGLIQRSSSSRLCLTTAGRLLADYIARRLAE